MSIENWHRARRTLREVTAYLGLIGKTTDRSTLAHRKGAEATAGRLHSLHVKTQVYFQPYDGATNYHGHNDFDVALADVIRKHFDALKDEAVALLRVREREAAQEAITELRQQLAEAEAETETNEDLEEDDNNGH